MTTTDISLVLLLGPQLTAFRDAGYDVIGVSAPGPYVRDLTALGIRHVPLRNATRSMAPWRDAAALVELARVFTRLRPDIVHTHNPKPGVYGRIAARIARVPVIVNTVHGLYAQPGDSWTRRSVVYGLERVASRFSDAELVQNVEDLPVLRRLGVAADKLHLLGNGVDLDRFDPERVPREARVALRRSWNVDDDTIVCGVVGRLVWEKGYREIIEAARTLRDHGSRIQIIVIGPHDDAKAEALTAADIARAEMSGNVRFVGERSDMESCYSAFDMYALASYREGFPRSAMEAAAMGLPVIATDIRGCRQVVDDGRTGRLVPVRNARAFTDALVELASDDDLRRRMSCAALEKASKEFDQHRCIDVTLNAYESLLARAGAGIAA